MTDDANTWAWVRISQVSGASKDKIAVRHGTDAISFSQLHRAAESTAAILDLDPGDRAIISAKNSIPVVILLAAIWRRGAIPVLLNEEAPIRHVEHALGKTRAKRIYAGATSIAAIPGSVPVPDVRSDHLPLPDGVLPPHGCTGSDHASIVFTSGSTGLPKGVTQRSATLIDGAMRIHDMLGYSQADSILCPVPFTFDYGWGQALSMFFTGVTLVLPEPPNGFGICAALDQHRPTILAGVPAVLADLLLGLAPLSKTYRDSVRLITNTGSKIPDMVFDALTDAFPKADISLNYGLTETYRSASLPFHLARSHRKSVGKPVPGVDLIIFREDGTPASVGESGEIFHFGAGLFDGYWDDPDATRATRIVFEKPDGGQAIGIKTGDFGHFGHDGLLYLQGRKDRIVKCMGVRISLAEIEAELYETGLVREVAITAADHNMFGSFITAHVVAHGDITQTEKDFIKDLRNRARTRLSNYMMPRRFLVYSELPKTTSRKHDYVELARLAAQ